MASQEIHQHLGLPRQTVGVSLGALGQQNQTLVLEMQYYPLRSLMYFGDRTPTFGGQLQVGRQISTPLHQVQFCSSKFSSSVGLRLRHSHQIKITAYLCIYKQLKVGLIKIQHS